MTIGTKVRINSKDGDATVLVGYHFVNDRRYPVMWPTGEYVVTEIGDVGGTHTGYWYACLRHTETGFADSLKGHQIDALRRDGVLLV